MNGKDYRALRRLSDRSGKVEFAAVGETCERVPEVSLPVLLASGKIEPVGMVDAPTSTKKRKKAAANG